jgi:hypothetical protein
MKKIKNWKITKIINFNYFTYLKGKDSYYFLQLVAQTKKTCQKIL